MLVAGVSTLLLLLASVHESVASTSSGHSNFRQAATTRFLQEDEDGDAVTTTTVNTTDIAANATIIPDTCPPCPQCSATTGIDGEILEEGDYPDDPLTLQILVVDSPGIITMGEWKCPVCRLRHLPPSCLCWVLKTHTMSALRFPCACSMTNFETTKTYPLRVFDFIKQSMKFSTCTCL